MPSLPDARAIEPLVLAALKSANATVPALARQIGQPVALVEAALERLETAGLVERTADTSTLTAAGRQEATHTVTSMHSVDLSAMDLSHVTRLVGALWPSEADRAAADEQERVGLLAADIDRDAAVQRLSAAFAEGRLTSDELERRTTSALSARTYGDLDGVLHGLEGLPRTVRNHPVREVVFWVVAVLSSPFVLLGTLLFAFGSDLGDHVGGLMFLLLLLPGLFALRRWAWSRR